MEFNSPKLSKGTASSKRADFAGISISRSSFGPFLLIIGTGIPSFSLFSAWLDWSNRELIAGVFGSGLPVSTPGEALDSEGSLLLQVVSWNAILSPVDSSFPVSSISAYAGGGEEGERCEDSIGPSTSSSRSPPFGCKPQGGSLETKERGELRSLFAQLIRFLGIEEAGSLASRLIGDFRLVWASRKSGLLACVSVGKDIALWRYAVCCSSSRFLSDLSVSGGRVLDESPTLYVEALRRAWDSSARVAPWCASSERMWLFPNSSFWPIWRRLWWSRLREISFSFCHAERSMICSS